MRSQPSCVRREMAVRVSRPLMPSGSSSRIRLPIQSRPPRGATASPNTEMINEPARTRLCWLCASMRACASAAAVLLTRRPPAPHTAGFAFGGGSARSRRGQQVFAIGHDRLLLREEAFGVDHVGVRAKALAGLDAAGGEFGAAGGEPSMFGEVGKDLRQHGIDAAVQKAA